MTQVPTSNWSNLAQQPIARQGARFAVAGGTVAMVYLGVTLLLSDVAGLPFEAALPIGYAVGISIHFTLQRFFVWTHDAGYALALHAQLARYVCLALAQYGITAAVTAELPQRIGVPKDLVYVVTAGTLTVVTFLLFRTNIFHHDVEEPNAEPIGAFNRGN